MVTQVRIIKNQEIIYYHRATGCSILLAKKTLESMSELLFQKVMQASLTQSTPFYDPIEDEPAFKEIMTQVTREAESVLQTSQPTIKRGLCYLVWKKKRILAERYQITWFSPHEMNPHIRFS